MVVTGSASDLNSLQISNTVSLLTREQTPWHRTVINNVEYKRKQKNLCCYHGVPPRESQCFKQRTRDTSLATACLCARWFCHKGVRIKLGLSFSCWQWSNRSKMTTLWLVQLIICPWSLLKQRRSKTTAVIFSLLLSIHDRITPF